MLLLLVLLLCRVPFEAANAGMIEGTFLSGQKPDSKLSSFNKMAKVAAAMKSLTSSLLEIDGKDSVVMVKESRTAATCSRCRSQSARGQRFTPPERDRE